MPYPSTRYSDLTAEAIRELESAFVPVVRRAIEELKPDILFCHHLFLLTAILRKNFPEQRIYGLCHGSDLRQMQNLLTFGAGYRVQNIDPAFIREGIRTLDRVYALHSEQIEPIREAYGVAPERLCVIGTGYNAGLFHCPPSPHEPNDPLRIVIAGKVCREKGVAELISALDILAGEDCPPFELLVMGGCRDDRIKVLLGASPGEPLPAGVYPRAGYAIRYLGFVTHEELAQNFRDADLFVLPSYYEGLPLVLVEALASGLETVCTDLPGVRKWLQDAIPDADTAFVALPPMAGVDVPEESGIPGYVERLSGAIRDKLLRIRRNEPRNIPDTAGASWDSVASRILV